MSVRYAIVTILAVFPLAVHAGVEKTCVAGDCQNGTGEQHYSTGAKYAGEFAGGKPHGMGKLILPDGNYIEGRWANGVPVDAVEVQGGKEVFAGEWSESLDWRNGTLTYTDSDGDKCKAIGPRKPDGDGTVLDGKAMIKCESGYEASGTFAGDRLNGYGEERYADGSIYTGNFLNGLRHGVGTFTWANGEKYHGAWANGKRHGKGKQIAANGTVIFEGQWSDDAEVKILESWMYLSRVALDRSKWENAAISGDARLIKMLPPEDTIVIPLVNNQRAVGACVDTDKPCGLSIVILFPEEYSKVVESALRRKIPLVYVSGVVKTTVTKGYSTYLVLDASAIKLK